MRKSRFGGFRRRRFQIFESQPEIFLGSAEAVAVRPNEEDGDGQEWKRHHERENVGHVEHPIGYLLQNQDFGRRKISIENWNFEAKM